MASQTQRPRYGSTGFHGERGGITPSAHVFRDTAMMDWYLWIATDGTFRWASADRAEMPDFNWNFDGNALAYREQQDGTAAYPAYTYALDNDTGQFRLGANNEGFSAGGTLRWDYNTIRMRLQPGYVLDFGGYATIGATPGGIVINNDLTVEGDISFSGELTFSEEFLAIDGTEAAPAYSFASSSNSGMYLAAPSSVAISVAAVRRLDISSVLITAFVPIDAPAIDADTLNVSGPATFVSATFAGPISAPTATFDSLSTTPLDAAMLTGTVADARLTANVLKHAGGYPGGTSSFLRSDGTFSTPTGVAPSAHHVSHEVGGADAITGALAVSSITSPSGSFTSLGATPLNAANLTGTVADARLTANVLKYAGGYPGGSTLFLRADGTFAAIPAIAAHAASHASGGSDPVSVITLSGYPGGVTSFLRADGTFAVPTATAAPHHANHEPGGSDALVNVAWTNLANTFTLTQTFGGEHVFTTNAYLRRNTTDGADNGFLRLTGGGGPSESRGAYLTVTGNEFPGLPGTIAFASGDIASAQIQFVTGPGTTQGVIHRSGGLSWGNAVDPGVGNLSVTGNVKAANLKWRQGHTWALVGDATSLTRLPSMIIDKSGSQAVVLASVLGKTVSGSVNVQVVRNGVNVGALMGVSSGLNGQSLGAVPLATNDEIWLVLSSPTAPTMVSVTVFLEHTL